MGLAKFRSLLPLRVAALGMVLISWFFPAVFSAHAAPRASFHEGALVLRDNGRVIFQSDEEVGEHALYITVHSVRRNKAGDYFIVYGACEWSRGWPPRDGNCGGGTESYIRWLHVTKDGELLEQQEGRQESCFTGITEKSIRWEKNGKLVWEGEGFERVDKEGVTKPEFLPTLYRWSYDPRQPEKGIEETSERMP